MSEDTDNKFVDEYRNVQNSIIALAREKDSIEHVFEQRSKKTVCFATERICSEGIYFYLL